MPPYVFGVARTDDNMSIFDMGGLPLVYPMAPPLVGNILGGGPPNYMNSPYKVFVHGNYAYVVTHIDETLTIIDISDPTNPMTVGFLVLPNAPNDVFVGNGNIFNGYAYVTVLDNSLRIIDVSDPTNPAIVGTIQGAGAPPGGNWLGSPQAVEVVGDLAYVCARAATDHALTIIDVSDPTTPTFVGSIQGAGAPPGGNWLGDAWAVKVRGNYAYVCAFSDNALTIIDISDPTNPTFVGSTQGAGAPPWLGGVRALALRDNYAYVCAYNDDSITVIDITNPAAPVFFSNIRNAVGVNAFDNPTDIAIGYPLAYVAAYAGTGTGNRISIIHIVNPAALVYLGSFAGAGAPNYMASASGVALITQYLPVVQTDPATGVT